MLRPPIGLRRPRRTGRRLAALLIAALAGTSCIYDVHVWDSYSADHGPISTAHVVVLSTGRVVVTDPDWSDGTNESLGAILVYDSAGTDADTDGVHNRPLVARLIGSTTGDRVGSGGVLELSNGNFVVLSPEWHQGTNAGAGAVTWMSGTTGRPRGAAPLDADGIPRATVGPTNSVFGSHAGDHVGQSGYAFVRSPNYLVLSPAWNDGRGAATWGNGTSGTVGAVVPRNSLIGASAGDQVGEHLAGETRTGNAVIGSPHFGNTDIGAATWMGGTGATTGVVSVANSLLGNSPGDLVGARDITPLTNGNWALPVDTFGSDDRGAVVWARGNGSTGGTISAANALVGATAGDRVGTTVVALTDGSYAVASPQATIGGVARAGAVTWADGTGRTFGTISTTNSWVGSRGGDLVGEAGVAPTWDGSFVIGSPHWNNGRGAASWVSGRNTPAGTIAAASSLVGSTSGDAVGTQVIALTNGNYLVNSPTWGTGQGAVTWGPRTGLVGTVQAANSLVGVRAKVTALPSGSWVAADPTWDAVSPTIVDAGMVFWSAGTGAVSGPINATNALVGSHAGDHIGESVTVLTNGNVVVVSPSWTDGATAHVGAVTWMSGTTGRVGPVTHDNSLVGSTANDRVGSGGLVALAEGHFEVFSPAWDSTDLARSNKVDKGAVSVGDGAAGSTVGPLTHVNSVEELIYFFPQDVRPLRAGTRLANGQMVLWVDGGEGLRFVDLAPAAPPHETASSYPDTPAFAARNRSTATVSWRPGPGTYTGPFSRVTYTATASPGGKFCRTTGRTCTITGLSATTNYTFTVRADNDVSRFVPAGVLRAYATVATTLVSYGRSLAPGASMPLGSYLLAPDARSTLLLTPGGDLVLVSGSTRTSISHTTGRGVAKLTMMRSGRPVLVDARGRAVWTAPIAHPIANSTLEVDHHQAFVHRGETIVWTAGSFAADQLVALTFGPGGRLTPGSFIPSANGQCGLGFIELLGGDAALALWGPAGFRSGLGEGGVLEFTVDGELVLRNGDAVTWSSGTHDPAARVVVDDACRLTLVSGNRELFTAG